MATSDISGMKIAVVCDSMSAYGGAERVIEQIIRIYPNADLFTTVDALPDGQRQFLARKKLVCSFLQNIPGIKKFYRRLLPLWPVAIEQLDVMKYDIVISSHHSVAYGVLTRPGQVHIAYVHSPMRYAWDLQHEYLREARLDHGLSGLLVRRQLHKLRIWDHVAAQRPDSLAANSGFVAERLWKSHRRRATIIYPPVAVHEMRCAATKGGYYISVGRLVPYKRTDLLVRAFARMPHRRLVIVGDGPERAKLTAIGAPNVEILGFQPNSRARELLASANAYMFAGIEDFGITAVEAQAAGTPVIALRGGGLSEIVLGMEHSNPTGIFFDEQSEDAIIRSVDAFEENAFCFAARHCMANAARFSVERFQAEFGAFVEDVVATRLNLEWAPPKRTHWPPVAASGEPVPQMADQER